MASTRPFQRTCQILRRSAVCAVLLVTATGMGLAFAEGNSLGSVISHAQTPRVGAESSTLPTGTQPLTFRWKDQKTDASFSGTLGRSAFSGTSTAPHPYTGGFDVKASFAGKSFVATLGISGVIKDGIEFRITGKLGATLVAGTAKWTTNVATLSSSMVISAKVGTQTISGSLSFHGSQDNVRGTIKIS
jgi:hypothetical protein